MPHLLLEASFAQWHQWVNDAALAAFAVFVCVVFYRIVMHGGRKALEIGERYVGSTEKLHDTLKQAEDSRSKLCERHANGLETITSAVQIGNNHLDKLVHMHEHPQGDVTQAIQAIHEDHRSIDQVKLAMIEACEAWRYVCKQEFPGCAEKVARHCDAIERIISEQDQRGGHA